jgi:hypothetical protein
MFKKLVSLLPRRSKAPTFDRIQTQAFKSEGLTRTLDGLGPEHAARARERVPQIIDGRANQARRALVRSVRERARDAEAQAGLAEKGALDKRERAVQLRDEGRFLEGGSLVRGVLLILCCAIGVAAEMALNLGTIPFLMDMPARSILGVAIAAAPTTAVLILDVILERGLEGPFRRRHLSTRGRRLALFVGMGAFMVAVGVLIVGNVLLYGEIREEARSVLSGVKEAVDTGLLRRTVLALGVLVAVAAAWFYTLGAAELRGWHDRSRSRRRQARATRAAEEAEKVARTARVAADNAGAEAADAERDATDVAAAFRAEALLQLELRLQPPPAPPVPPQRVPTAEEVIDLALRRRMARRAGAERPRLDA